MTLSKRISMAFGALLVITVAALAALALHDAQRPVDAQGSDAARAYGVLIPVNSQESYRSQVAEWQAPTPEHREITKSSVFTWEMTGNATTDRAAKLLKLNELAADGWRLIDAESGLLERNE